MFLPRSGYFNTPFSNKLSPSRLNDIHFEGLLGKQKKQPIPHPEPDSPHKGPQVGSLENQDLEKILPEKQPQFLDLMNRPDRKPTYWRNSPRNLVIALMAGFGFAVSADAVKKFHHWSDETAIALKNPKNAPPSQQKGDPTQVQLPPLAPKIQPPNAGVPVVGVSDPQTLEEVPGKVQKSEAQKLETPVNDSDAWEVILKQVPSKEEVLNGIAKTDHTLHHTPVVGYMMDLYVNLIRWEALTIAILA
ncbi:MAG: hypothetical protein K2X66_13630, partial [Cyanobacteria bacterium]|nr:hypothetical protein [Cyanobacteriota bacterium]